MNTTISNFQSFAASINLKIEFASENENEWYLNLFSYDGPSNREYLMYLYGENQFDTVWEYEYHDCLTIGRKLLNPRDKVLILGSGDLMNHRFLGKHDVDLVDIDPFMTDLAESNSIMLQLNKYISRPNYRIHNLDAVLFIEENREKISEYRYIVIDFPVMISPIADEVKKFGLEKFFSKEMFSGLLLRNLSTEGLITMQADDTIVHREHKKYFEELLEWTGIFFHIYSIFFEESGLYQYFYMFTKNPDIFRYFRENIHSVTANPGLFRKDAYFTSLFELLEREEITYPEYTSILAGK